MKGSLCRLAETSFLWRDTAMRIRERFNPRAPCGARHHLSSPPHKLRNFNPRAPCGARLQAAGLVFSPNTISTHAPLAGRDVAIAAKQRKNCTNFNPRAPCGARRCHSRKTAKELYEFQPTRPLRGATSRTCAPSQCVRYFNPRAPCGARPDTASRLAIRAENFNPRAPQGARHDSLQKKE